MAKTPVLDPGGPWLSAAFFCGAVLEEADGSRSIRGIHQGMEFDANAPVRYAEPVLFVSIIGGSARGTHRLEMYGTGPGQRRELVFEHHFVFDGVSGGHDAWAVIKIDGSEEGFWAFDLLLNGKRLTRLFYRIIHVVTERSSPM